METCDQIQDRILGVENYKRLTFDELNDDGVVALVGAIARSAVEDYASALRLRNAGKIKELERFLTGEYFMTLSSLNGQALIEKVRRDYKKEIQDEWSTACGDASSKSRVKRTYRPHPKKYTDDDL